MNDTRAGKVILPLFMKQYAPRTIEFFAEAAAGDWRFKVYTITTHDRFRSHPVLQQAIEQLIYWTQKANRHSLRNYRIGCLIVHEAQEAIFSVVNWWVGENMLQNHVYVSPYERTIEFKRFSDGGIQFCVWELEVVWFERNQWIKHVLQHPNQPNFEDYLNAHYESFS